MKPLRRERGCLLADEGGFTLSEMMVTILVMTAVFFALHSIFSTSVRIFSFGNDKVEAVENARIGLERMEREIRAAYPYDKANTSATDDHLLFSLGSPGSPTSSLSNQQITFGNDLNGDLRLGCPISVTDTRCEYVTYKLTNPNDATACTVAPCTLRRLNSANASSAGDALIGVVAFNGLRFSYLRADGTPASSEGEVERVQVRLQVNVDGRTQNLTTDADLRNRL